MDSQVTNYGVLADGRQVQCVHLENEKLKVQLIDYGLRLISLQLKTTEASTQELVLGGSSLEFYERDDAYLGAVVGRTCNRIENAQVAIGDQTFNLDKNDGEHHLHGGKDAFHNRIWNFKCEQDCVTFETFSPDGQGGYPGNCWVQVRISLVSDSLVYEYSGRCDADTLLDMTNHAYFCLDDSRSIVDHELMIRAQKFVPVDHDLIPTGELLSVHDTLFDFRQGRVVRHDADLQDWSADNSLTQVSVDRQQLKIARGYDHSWLLESATNKGEPQNCAAWLYSAKSDICLKVYTTQPGIQLYTGNHLQKPYSGLCLETQHLPNACNQRGFASPELKVGEEYSQVTRFQFTMRDHHVGAEQS